MIEKTNRKYIQSIDKDTTATSRTFWNDAKLFITNQCTTVNKKIFIRAEIDEDVMVKDTRENALIKTSDLINNESVIVEIFNQNYENIVENLPGKASNGLGDPLNADSDKTTVLELIKKYLNDLCIVKIKNFFFDIGLFDFPE